MLVLGDSRFDLALDVHALYDVFAVAPQEIVDRLDANPYRSGWLIFVQVLERKMTRQKNSWVSSGSGSLPRE